MPVTALSIFLASTVASLSLDCLLHPLDTIKTRIQSPEFVGTLRGSRTSILSDTKILRGLYQGLGPVLVTSFPSAGVFFYTYENIRTKLAFASDDQSQPTSSTLVLSDISASCVAEIAACLIYAPTELLKQNAQIAFSPSTKSPTLQTSRQHPSASRGTAVSVLLKNIGGPTQLWKGYWALLAHNLPWVVIQMPLYEALRRYMSRSGSQTKKKDTFETVMNASLSAALAGGITGLSTAPMDVIKTRVNLDSSDQKSGRKGVIKATQGILKTEGLRGLYRGCGINTFMAVVGSGLYFGLYEGETMAG
ncbi:mitochondrial carrier domain-containing protein [Penicillium verhagenii]|nr:mitochondrial carrier domain-containing protein [Penicillium verhagenii]